MALALTSDLRYATTNARFRMPAVCLGLVHEAVSPELFDGLVDKRIRGIEQLAPLTLRHIVDEPQTPDEDTVQAAIRACYDSEDYMEGQPAFMQKRWPGFVGLSRRC